MVGVPLRDSHFGSHGAILPFVAFQTSPSCSRRSPTFHNFVKLSLTKNPKKRPTAEKLLSVRESITCSSIFLGGVSNVTSTILKLLVSFLAQHPYVAQGGLTWRLAVDLLDKMNNPDNHQHYTEVDDDDLEVTAALQSANKM